MPGLPAHLWRQRRTPRGGRDAGARPAAVSGRRRVSRDRAAAGREPCLGDELWVKAQAQALPPLPGVDPAEVEWVECDELCTFIGKKSVWLALVGY